MPALFDFREIFARFSAAAARVPAPNLQHVKFSLKHEICFGEGPSCGLRREKRAICTAPMRASAAFGPEPTL